MAEACKIEAEPDPQQRGRARVFERRISQGYGLRQAAKGARAEHFFILDEQELVDAVRQEGDVAKRGQRLRVAGAGSGLPLQHGKASKRRLLGRGDALQGPLAVPLHRALHVVEEKRRGTGKV